VCYGRGGTRPTVTDAHLVCGRLDPAAFLPGLDVDADRVREAIATHLVAELEGGVEAAARGVLEVANATMERALRVVSVERGYDPREFALVAFGGAGPLHAASLAAAVGIPRVVVPRTAGVLSALGLLISDVVYDYGVSRVRPWSAVEPATLSEPFDEFAARGRDRLSAEGFDADATVVDRSVDVRYAGQSFELRVPVPDGPVDEGTLSTVAERFHERHRRRYGHAYPAEPVELVTVRTRARGVVDPPELRPEPVAGSVDDAVRERRPVSFGGDPVETVVYEREGLPTGGDFDGPAVIEGAESTIAVPPDQRVRVDDYGSVVVEVDA
jgi:N-methylhydantoinase A